MEEMCTSLLLQTILGTEIQFYYLITNIWDLNKKKKLWTEIQSVPLLLRYV